MKGVLNNCKIYILPVLLIVILLFFAGCENKKEEEGLNVYCLKEDNGEFTCIKYSSDTTDIIELANELILKIKNPDKKGYKSVWPDSVYVEDVNCEEQVFNLYLNSGYNSLDSASELLLRASIVKTLSQVEGIKYIQLHVGGSPAQYSDGTYMGYLRASDFIDDSAVGMDSIMWQKVTFYYCNERGDKLVSVSENIAYNKNSSMERIVVEKLIKGPSDKKMQASLPATVKVLDISVNEGVCYVNLDGAFLTEMVNVSAEIPVYSIVNTLCGIKGIKSVKIFVNGNPAKYYRETVRIDSNLEFNYDILETEQTAAPVYQGK